MLIVLLRAQRSNAQRMCERPPRLKIGKSTPRRLTAVVFYVLNHACNRERKCANTILAHCWFRGLAISNAKIYIYLSNKI